MPIIDQEELDDLNKKIRTLNREVEDTEEEVEDVKKHRLILLIISIVLFLLLFFGMLTYMFSPSTFMDTAKFESLGYKVMSQEEYTQISEILDSQSSESNLDDVASENYDVDSEATYNSEPSTNLSGAIVYAVQIAAFEDKGIALYSDNLVQFKENQSDNYYKYSLGAFETLEEAQQFRKELLKLGFRDAFIASYQNGDRLKIEEAW